MPLMKFWNALRGRSAPAASQTDSPDSAGQPDRDVQSADSQPRKPNKKAKPPSTRSGSALAFFGAGPHAGLCRQLKSISASKVLEISVDDGQRAVAVMKTLGKSGQKVDYLAIDQFEMPDQPETAGQLDTPDQFETPGRIELKAFYRLLRSKQIRARLFPGAIDRGLRAVANTVGAVDVVLIGAAAEKWQTPAVRSALLRVCHAETAVFWIDGDVWRPLALEASVGGSAPLRRAA